MQRPEILAPAGNPDKLRTALHFGADAVYLGMKHLSLRASVGSFGDDELEWAIGYAHERGRRVYVALNIQPFDSDFEGLESALCRLSALGPDAVIVADPSTVSFSMISNASTRILASTKSWALSMNSFNSMERVLSSYSIVMN